MDLSVVIPAYKSADILLQQLPVLLSWTGTWQLETEIIVVVDGDDVSAYSQLLQHLPVTICGYEQNRGKGYAIKYGFARATAPIIIYTDADIPFTAADMLQMANVLHANAAKQLCVIGDRTLPGSSYYEQISTTRKLGSNFFLLVIKHTLGKDFADTQCGLKGFTRTAAEAIFKRSHINRFAFDFECLFISRHLKIDVEKIAVTLRNQSPSTVRIYSDGLKLLKDIFKIIFYYKYD